MENLGNRYALVSGASTGLGRCFALELARRGINTVLVALPGSGLQQTVAESRRQGVQSVGFEADLSDQTQLERLCERINAGFQLGMLINNAGCGGTRCFTDSVNDYWERIIKLNVWATTMLTHRLLPNLMQAGKAYILNVSSMAAFTPIGYKTVYGASKSYILHFTRSLYAELRPEHVQVSVVTPGPMMTNEDVCRRIRKQGLFGKIGLLSPEKVARISLNRLFHRQSIILPGWMNKLNWALMQVIPVAVRLPLVSRVVAREIKQRQQ